MYLSKNLLHGGSFFRLIENVVLCEKFCYLYIVQTRLSYNGIPVNGALLRSAFENLKAPKAKIERLVKTDEIIRLRRGLYMDTERKVFNNFLAANYIVSPSYVSGLTALWYHDVIPEAVVDTISMTTKKTSMYHNPLGVFTYHHCSSDYFFIGIQERTILGNNVLIAGVEKALCDHITSTPNLNLRYVGETRRWLEEDMRMDMDELSHMDLSIISACANNGKKKKMLSNIIKIFS